MKSGIESTQKDVGGNVLAANLKEAMACILQQGSICESFTLRSLWMATADSRIPRTNPPI